jgi:aspartate ammonia-lyase
VNLGQSTNDAYPTALKVGLLRALARIDGALAGLQEAFTGKALEFAQVVKMGRTQLQDAVPMTLGQEFGAFAVMVEEDRARLREVNGLLCEINLGGTAIGTRINGHPDYQLTACAALAAASGFAVTPAIDLVEATQDTGVFIQLSGVLKRTALKLSKVCNDLRLLSSGPRAGLNEITLPPRQAGSSIMPGKVNPVIPEMVNQVAFEVVGNDVTISFAAEAGQLQLNAFEPIIAHCLFASIAHLDAAVRTLDRRCIRGIRANHTQLQKYIEDSIGVVTALNPYIGYRASTEIAAEALQSGRGVVDLVVERGLLSRIELDSILDPRVLAAAPRTD